MLPWILGEPAWLEKLTCLVIMGYFTCHCVSMSWSHKSMLLMLLLRKVALLMHIQILMTSVYGPHKKKHAIALMSFTTCSTTVRYFSFQAICIHVTNASMLRKDGSSDTYSNSYAERRWPTQQKTCVCLNVFCKVFNNSSLFFIPGYLHPCC